MYMLLTSDGSAPQDSKVKAVDEAVLKFLAAGGDVELFAHAALARSGRAAARSSHSSASL
jgi:hypothetical protein